jgi:hypothetical protein
VRVTASQQGSTGWGANGGSYMKIGKLHAIVCQFINIWRGNGLRSITAQIGITHIVHENKYDIRLLICYLLFRLKRSKNENDKDW